MKTVKFQVKNADTVFTRELNLGIDGRTTLKPSVAFGTVLNDLFELVNLQKQNAVKLFKFSQPFDVKIEYDRKVIDTAVIPSELKTKFKLNSNPKRQKAFAKNVFAILNYVTSDSPAMSAEELASKLDAKIQKAEVVK